MKKALSIFVICLLSLLLVGCGCEKKKEKENNGDTIEQQIEKTISSLYTDDSKLVYKNGDVYKLVFYYKDNEITGLEHYYEYERVQHSGPGRASLSERRNHLLCLASSRSAGGVLRRRRRRVSRRFLLFSNYS